MGIIDPSITYTFFYALPCALLIVYFTPLIRQYYHQQKTSFRKVSLMIWVPLGVVLCLSGPLNPGIVIVLLVILLFHVLWSRKNKLKKINVINSLESSLKKPPKPFWIFILPVFIFSIYSLYLGQYNSHNSIYTNSLSNLYINLPKGLYLQFTQKLGFPILFLFLGINAFVILKLIVRSDERIKVLSLYKWIGVFSLFYILLLPLGGYRDYRPNVLRYDTIMPITLGLFFLFGTTTLFIIKNSSKKRMLWYVPFLCIVLLIFSIADNPGFDKNTCEKKALSRISKTKKRKLKLYNNCTVLSWDIIREPEKSELNAQLLKIWNITDEKVLYYH